MKDDDLQWFKEKMCKYMGHNDVVITTGGNFDLSQWPQRGYSTWGYFHCSRCNRDERFQYDE